jgi:hypothetical protein
LGQQPLAHRIYEEAKGNLGDRKANLAFSGEGRRPQSKNRKALILAKRTRKARKHPFCRNLPVRDLQGEKGRRHPRETIVHTETHICRYAGTDIESAQSPSVCQPFRLFFSDLPPFMTEYYSGSQLSH